MAGSQLFANFVGSVLSHSLNQNVIRINFKNLNDSAKNFEKTFDERAKIEGV